MKQRVSTTADAGLLGRARGLDPDGTDASMIEQAMRALIKRHRRGEIDASYDRAWAEHPLDAPDEWGDLASFGSTVNGR